MRRAARGAHPGVIFGIGVDILHVARMEKIRARHGERLADKILCDAERREYERRANRARFLAMAFAGKEAFVKALGTGFQGIGYRDAGIARMESGQPVLVYSDALKARLKRMGVGAGHVSLSDEGGVVCAFVVLERGSR